jgi:hypothetical protein
MVDFTHMPPFPERFAQPLRTAVSGERAIWPQSITSEELKVIDAHGMSSIVYAHSRLPELRDTAIRDAAVEALRLADLRSVLDALAARGVVPLIVKGTALAYSIYSEPELRPRGDTDLLIDANDIDAVRETLAPMGFRERLTSGDDLTVRQRSFERIDRFGVSHAYDVHLDIANPPVVARTLTYDDMRSRAIAIPRIAPNAMAPSMVDSLLYACIHRVVHHHRSGRFMWLYDVHLLGERLSEGERAEFWSRAAERRVITICKQTIEDARDAFGGGDLAATSPAVVADEPSSAFLVTDRSRGALLAHEFSSLTWRERLQRLRQLAFPPAAFVMESFGTRNRAALPLLYAWRSLRGVARLFRRL